MRKTIRHIILVVVLLCIGVVGLLTVSCRFGACEEKEHRLTVMTWNTHSLSQYAHVEKNEVVRYLREHPADVVCLQECAVVSNGRGMSLEELKEAMGKEYKYSYFDFKVHNARIRYGNIVYSKYPIVNKRTIPYESKGNISSQCDVIVGGDTMGLFVNHLESNRLSDSDIEDTETMSHKISLAKSIRWKQAKVLRAAIDSCQHRHLVVGDFNTPPFTLTYLNIRRTMQDCFLNGSNGKIGNTYYWHHIGVRIDYILTDRNVGVLESHVDYDAKGSDHYPVWTELTW